ncbi:aminoglycoside phosphotransferase family protein [Deinococcus arenicola]|uniref:Aminoglycoside phosphotransferase family protein n=1 Tax=Deinococcus arenicola TaxID=2994950 RepID=A0ABU4DPZ5_9DEIO|nr:aminoglycoside phosphotransferase family protein [Deinococcus sp. ZS9-10]MDV6374443.1 aminoglycoside phosphotransferase family protein [Deinococcus sp. ZS9-10]
MTPDPATLFTRHGLSVSGLRRAEMGFSNEVWLTDTAVLRLGTGMQFGTGMEYGREAAVALGALAAGVHTARPLFWEPEYSLWERLPGQMPTPAQLTPDFWNAVLNDLERLHAVPPEPCLPRPSEWWVGDLGLMDGLDWTPAEQAALRRVRSTPYPLTAPVFVHGDAYRHNLLADQGGHYAGLLDWGNAGWATLEHECAVLDDLEPALERWNGRIDLDLLWRLRLELLLRVAAAGRVSVDTVREALARCEGKT